MYDKCGYLLGECAADDKEIHRLITNLSLDSYVAGCDQLRGQVGKTGRREEGHKANDS